MLESNLDPRSSKRWDLSRDQKKSFSEHFCSLKLIRNRPRVQNPIYRSKQPSAFIRKAHGAHRTLFYIGQNSLRLLSAKHMVRTEPYFFIGQNSLRLLSAKHMVLTEPYFLSVKTTFGFCPQSTWCAPSPIFYRSKQLSASIRKAPGAHRTLFFIGQNSLRLVSATHTVLTEP